MLAKERRCAAEVNAHRHEDGDIEPTQKKHIYWKMTHICEKIDLCYATAKILQRGEKNKGTVQRTVGKIAARKNFETTDTSRTHKDAK